MNLNIVEEEEEGEEEEEVLCIHCLYLWQYFSEQLQKK